MINQNITFHLPKYNSNMFCVLKVIRREGGREGWGRRKFYLRAELIKCIDPNEGEALKGGREGGREGGRGGRKSYLGGRIDQMY